jgi:hypothetical protein
MINGALGINSDKRFQQTSPLPSSTTATRPPFSQLNPYPHHFHPQQHLLNHHSLVHYHNQARPPIMTNYRPTIVPSVYQQPSYNQYPFDINSIITQQLFGQIPAPPYPIIPSSPLMIPPPAAIDQQTAFGFESNPDPEWISKPHQLNIFDQNSLSPTISRPLSYQK